MFPKNALQERLQKLNYTQLAPDPLVHQETVCTIEVVYDQYRMQQTSIDSDLASMIVNNPGYLFARVRLLDETSTLILPFKEPKELMHLVYGNSLLIEGRTGIITYRNQDIVNGFLSIKENLVKKQLKLSKVSNVFDISGIG